MLFKREELEYIYIFFISPIIINKSDLLKNSLQLTKSLTSIEDVIPRV